MIRRHPPTAKPRLFGDGRPNVATSTAARGPNRQVVSRSPGETPIDQPLPGKPVTLMERPDWLGILLRVGRKSLVPVSLLGTWTMVTYVWPLASGSRLIRPIFLPGPQDLWLALMQMGRHLPEAVLSSVSMTLLGFLMGTALGIGIGVTMAYSKVTRELFGGILDFLRPVPALALIPLFILWFGIGRGPQIALIVFGTSVILGLTTIEAIRNVPPVYIRAALTLGASRFMIYRTVIVPSITPHILGAIRVAGVASWGLDVAAEFIGAQTGLGYLIIVRQQYLDTPGILLIVVIYSLLALGLDHLIRAVERPITKWTERATRRGIVASLVGAT
jgi:ABC-type nitrate/sulfonate/bicarbonate transport system permease component